MVRHRIINNLKEANMSLELFRRRQKRIGESIEKNRIKMDRDKNQLKLNLFINEDH